MPYALFPPGEANPLAGDGRTPLVMFGPARGRAFIAVAARAPAFDVRQLTPGARRQVGLRPSAASGIRWRLPGRSCHQAKAVPAGQQPRRAWPSCQLRRRSRRRMTCC